MTGLPNDLPDAARAYIAALPRGRLAGFPMTAIDRTGVPAWKVALFLDDAEPAPRQHAVGLRLRHDRRRGDHRGPGRDRGGDLPDPTPDADALSARQLSAACARRRPRPHRRSADPLPAGRLSRRSRHGIGLDRGGPGRATANGCWFRSMSRRPTCSSSRPGYRTFTTLITNGLGAGPDLDWAIGHGLLESLQRDGNGLVFRALDQGVVLDLDEGLSPETRALVDHLDRCGIEILPKYATDAFGLANLYVVGFDRKGHGPRGADHAVGLRRSLRSRPRPGAAQGAARVLFGPGPQDLWPRPVGGGARGRRRPATYAISCDARCRAWITRRAARSVP